MEIIPAIDLRGGNVVRLFQGEYDQETVYFDNPAQVAKLWQDGGAPRIHIVDLDGARDGEMKNHDAILSIAQAVSVPTQLGGGLREMADVDRLLGELGVSRAILGSVLLEKPELVREAAMKHPGQIILGIDARNGMMATRGWREDSEAKAVDLVNEFSGLAIAAVVYTDIARDGTLEGPNIAAQLEMSQASPFPVIASGGIGNLDHVKALAEASRTEAGKQIKSVIIGKALYEKKFTLAEAIQCAG